MKTTAQNHSAKYLDSGFYLVSDKAAGALCSVIGQKLPPLGSAKFVMLKANGFLLNAWMQRTPVSALANSGTAGRNWSWAIYSFRRDANAYPYVPALGKAFKFTPIASTVEGNVAAA